MLGGIDLSGVAEECLYEPEVRGEGWGKKGVEREEGEVHFLNRSKGGLRLMRDLFPCFFVPFFGFVMGGMKIDGMGWERTIGFISPKKEV